MTGKAIDYSTKEVSFYKLICDDLNITDCYVGHTVNFTERKAHHKWCCHNENKEYHRNIYQIIRETGGFSCWKMIEIEKRIVSSKREAEKIEQEIKEELHATLNTYNPNPLKNDLIGEEAHIEYHKQYELNRRGTHKESNKKWYELNKERVIQQKKENILCDCGICCRKCFLVAHKRTDKHKRLIEQKQMAQEDK